MERRHRKKKYFIGKNLTSLFCLFKRHRSYFHCLKLICTCLLAKRGEGRLALLAVSYRNNCFCFARIERKISGSRAPFVGCFYTKTFFSCIWWIFTGFSSHLLDGSFFFVEKSYSRKDHVLRLTSEKIWLSYAFFVHLFTTNFYILQKFFTVFQSSIRFCFNIFTFLRRW